ncbi:DUF3604 domain-containing protein [Paraurantiacibacter namhicola]|uniref:DUF3604 domain-containing protein n=1 Tax=Paraurantiacibacter namhicola TaxID=645517 RepID=UPI00196A0D02|nr:DUF3604 domain-containing protein [Paraurantiacibacter namhicola]
MTRALMCGCAALALAGCSAEQRSDQAEGEGPGAQLAATPDKLLWGDLHTHSNMSFDAYSFGTHHFSPEDSYRFARGEAVTSTTGVTAKLQRPLDFLLVADHAEYLGLMQGIERKDPLLQQHALSTRWSGFVEEGRMIDVIQEFVAITSGEAPAEPLPLEFSRNTWAGVIASAEKYNDPGKFTTMIGYEWSAMKSGDNLHRVVMFADGPEKALQTLPYSALESNDPEQLWKALATYETNTGGRVLTIPHNGNLSDGAMFPDKTMSGEPLSIDYRKTRHKFEPVVEVTQVKGDGETHQHISPHDEFADFENWDETDLGRNPRTTDKEELRRQMQGEYARGALKKGLLYTAFDGINPFEFGMIGSTDVHTGIPAVAEDNFFGKFPDSEPSALRLASSMGGALWGNATLSAAGYVGVWARANTRKEIFDAMVRREVYASTGPRIELRLFGGWEFSSADLVGEALVANGYAKGVPMGGILTPSKKANAPGFLLHAAMDPDGAYLDRIQIVKGWRDSDGTLHEQVYDVALSDGRKVDPATGKAPPVGSTVDVKTATFTNSIGEPELRTFWVDPEFDAGQQAFYYARVLQIPTPRWTTYDAVRYNLDLPPNVPAETQDRVYSSPIWYRAPR